MSDSSKIILVTYIPIINFTYDFKSDLNGFAVN